MIGYANTLVDIHHNYLNSITLIIDVSTTISHEANVYLINRIHHSLFWMTFFFCLALEF